MRQPSQPVKASAHRFVSNFFHPERANFGMFGAFFCCLEVKTRLFQKNKYNS